MHLQRRRGFSVRSVKFVSGFYCILHKDFIVDGWLVGWLVGLLAGWLAGCQLAGGQGKYKPRGGAGRERLGMGGPAGTIQV